MLAHRATFEGIRRGDLPAETVNLDGREVTALRVGAEAGERMGFEPGDVVIVSPAPPTQPAGPD
jgi:hypothetical protein